jgi:hypothetical protein
MWQCRRSATLAWRLAEPESATPNGEADGLWPHVPVVQVSDYNLYFHIDADTADTVPWTGLESVTRACAKIIDRVNGLDLPVYNRANEARFGTMESIARR